MRPEIEDLVFWRIQALAKEVPDFDVSSRIWLESRDFINDIADCAEQIEAHLPDTMDQKWALTNLHSAACYVADVLRTMHKERNNE